MGWPRPLVAFPLSFAAYCVGWWGIAHASGVLHEVLPFLWIGAYFGVFWGGWAAIPLLGACATLFQPMLPERTRRPVRRWFLGWCAAWVGVLVALLWLGAPPRFEQVPFGG